MALLFYKGNSLEQNYKTVKYQVDCRRLENTLTWRGSGVIESAAIAFLLELTGMKEVIIH